MPSHFPARRGFTLVELLVVIGIISALIGILLPVTRNARDQAQRVKCLANLKQIGVALSAYIAENKGSYPYHEFWYNQSGKRGDLAAFNIAPFPPIDQTGLRSEPGTLFERPLNPYLKQSAEVSACPADRGDAKKASVTNCFDAYGTSYQIQWNEGNSYAPFGVLPLTGYSEIDAQGNRRFDALGRPAARYGSAIRFQNQLHKFDWTKKIVLGDFNWHGNRPIVDQRVLWHRPTKRNERQQNILFADGHAEFFTFPRNYGSATLPVNPALNGFW